MALANLSIYYNWKNIKPEYNNNKFKTSAPIWNDTFDLLDGSYSIADIQDYFEFNIKNHETLTEIPPVQVYPNKIKNRIVFKIKTGYKLELLTLETNKLLVSTEKDVDKDKDCKNVPKLESVEVVLVLFNLVKNDYQNTSKVLFTFVPNKQFDQLINISPHSLTMKNTVNTEFSYVEVWFTDRASKALAREFGDKYDKILMDTATKTGTDAPKTASKRVVQKTAEATGDLIGNKIADRIFSIDKSKEKKKDKRSRRNLHSTKKRQQIIDDLKSF